MHALSRMCRLWRFRGPQHILMQQLGRTADPSPMTVHPLKPRGASANAASRHPERGRRHPCCRNFVKSSEPPLCLALLRPNLGSLEPDDQFSKPPLDLLGERGVIHPASDLVDLATYAFGL